MDDRQACAEILRDFMVGKTAVSARMRMHVCVDSVLGVFWEANQLANQLESQLIARASWCVAHDSALRRIVGVCEVRRMANIWPVAMPQVEQQHRALRAVRRSGLRAICCQPSSS